MSDRISSRALHEALTQVRSALVPRAGADARVDEEELSAALAAVPPEARPVVDSFARDLARHEGGQGFFSVSALDHAIAQLRAELPHVREDLAISFDDAAVKRFGEGLLTLARRLEGVPGAVLPPLPPETFEGLSGDALIAALRERCATHLPLRYYTARQAMYHLVDNEEGKVACVYTGKRVSTVAVEDAGINAEHTLPQSRGANALPAKSDLHHLFPTDVKANRVRGDHPFGVVVQSEWESGGAKLGFDESGRRVFEPPDDHKGNVARALFYMAAMYGVSLPDEEERVLRRWNGEDPVDERERRRNDLVSSLQGNRNPFVDHQDLVDRIDDL